MIFEGSFEVNAPRQQVWDFLLDVERVAKCVPGMEHCEKRSENEYALVVKQKVAFLKVSINLKAVITEAVPPNRVESVFQGSDGKIGTSVKQKNVMELQELSPTRTEVSYRSDVSFLGKLGTLGRPIIKAKANKIMNEFGKAVQSNVEKTYTAEYDAAGGANEAL